MRDNILMAKSMARANLLGLMEVLLQESSTIITFMGMEFTSGLMEECFMESGGIIRWRGMEHLPGQMGESMLDSITKT